MVWSHQIVISDGLFVRLVFSVKAGTKKCRTFRHIPTHRRLTTCTLRRMLVRTSPVFSASLETSINDRLSFAANSVLQQTLIIKDKRTYVVKNQHTRKLQGLSSYSTETL